jgi:hypothetical protein
MTSSRLRSFRHDRDGLPPLVVVESDDRWVDVGDGNGRQDGRRRHWISFDCLAVTAEPLGGRLRSLPFVTLKQAREAMVTGRYRNARQNEPRRLRLADELLGPQPPAPDEPLVGLNHHEARVLADLTGGRLADEKEIEVLASHLAADLDPFLPMSVWSRSPYSPWSYAWCYYDPDADLWLAADRSWDVSDDQQISVLRILRGLRMERVCARPSAHEVAGSPCCAWVVFDVRSDDEPSSLG